MRYLPLLLMLFACGPAVTAGPTDGGTCQLPVHPGIVLVGPMGASTPTGCLDGKTGEWIDLRYAMADRPGIDFTSVGITVNLGHSQNGSFQKTSDYFVSKQVSSAADLPAAIWVDLSSVDGATSYQLNPWTFDGLSYGGHTLPVLDITPGHVELYDLRLDKPTN